MTSQVYDLAREIFIQAAGKEVPSGMSWEALVEYCIHASRRFYDRQQTVAKEKSDDFLEEEDKHHV